MYLDRYFGNHSFTLNEITDRRGIHLNITYNEEPHPFQNEQYQDELYIQDNQAHITLYKKLKKLFIESGQNYIGQVIRLERYISSLNYFLYCDGKQIGLIRDSEEWDDIAKKQWDKNDELGFSDIEQAIFFGTTEQEINVQFSIKKKEKRLTKPKSSVFPIKKVGNDIVIYGAAISSSIGYDGDQIHGTMVQNGQSVNIKYSDSLFHLIKENKVKELCDEIDDDNILTINSQASYTEPFFNSILQNREDGIDIYIWLKLENLGTSQDGILQFDSYYYAVSRNRGELIKQANSLETDFLRQIIYLSSTSSQLLFQEIQQKNEERRKQALKSAVSAIMCRNMSHNLGSHCIQYTNSDILNLIKHSINNAPNLRGLGHLLSYIQGRMDFLATLVSGDTLAYGPVDFISNIYYKLVYDSVLKSVSKNKINELYKIIKNNTEFSEILKSFADILIAEERNIDETNRNYTNLLSALEGIESKLIKNKIPINYLLENLVKSEHFVRNPSKGERGIDIKLQINDEYVQPNSGIEVDVAIPGSFSSIHAFFIIIENLIRNAAKHAPVSELDNLIETINIKYDSATNDATFIIYDNKQNANDVVPLIRKRLDNLHILSDDLQINKENKGLKEILTTILWMRAVENDKSYQDILYEIEANNDDKIKFIEKYGFTAIGVDDKGHEVSNVTKNNKANFGIKFTLPLYKIYHKIDESEQYKPELKHFKADIILCTTQETYNNLSKKVPRVVYDDGVIRPDRITRESVIEPYDENNDFCIGAVLLKKIITKRYRISPDDIQIIFADDGYMGKNIDEQQTVYFKRHLNRSLEEFENSKQYLYADSVSGDNYTYTLQEKFRSGIQQGQFIKWSDKYFSYKIIESALTRITIIDERFFGVYSDNELQMKNIRILNLKADIRKITKLDEAFEGSTFKDCKNSTTFLSIHLGIIEKLLTSSGNWFDKGHEGYNTNHNCNISKISYLIILLKKYFFEDSPSFISIHSGRGNYSYEMEQYFKNYPFITLSALWDTFSNSKYQLTQLFLNLTYNNDND